MTERDNQEPQQQSYTSSDADNTTVRTQAAFVNKLYKMLEDATIQSLISWSDRGDLFSVSNPTAFSKSVLPQYFKHSNWQSFVRQLNMYGFHKVNDMIHSNLTSDNQTWEFKHPHFKRGEIDDLQNIKRKSTKPNFSSLPARISNNPRVPSENDENIYGPMYKHILHIEDRLHYVSKSYEILKNETNTLRGLLSRQQETIGEFAALLSDVLGDDANLNMNESKKDSVLSKLSDLQSLFVAGSPSQASSSSNSQMMPNIFNASNHEDYNRRHSFVKQSSSPTATRSFEQFLLAQQHHQYQNHQSQEYQGLSRSPDARQHYNNNNHSISSTPPPQSSSSPSVTNRRMGFGKESHLLNPEPSMNDNFRDNKNSIDDKYIKKRRTE